MRNLILRASCLMALLALITSAAHSVTIDWVTVGDPGNAADDTGYGSVTDVYRISKYEVTRSQYTEFLNAVAATDTNKLYHTDMLIFSGIKRSGSPGSYSYSVNADAVNKPVGYVTFYDTLRFVNWLHNGQLTGAQDSTTTEDGAYDMSLGSSVVRKAGATIFLTSEDEWYKAAYYDAVSTSYFDYPAGSDVQTTCASPGATPNTAHCGSSQPAYDVGSYTGSASPAGTFDQGGNVWEWTEGIMGSARAARGGAANVAAPNMAAAHRWGVGPGSYSPLIGIRVAMIPEPSTAILLAAGLAGLAAVVGRRTH